MEIFLQIGGRMKIGIIGNGLLGSELYRQFQEQNISNVIIKDYPDIDITELSSLSSFIEENKLTHIINCAAYTDVVGAESNKGKCFLINGFSLSYLSKVCKEKNVHVTHFSTEFIFDGKKEIPYKEFDKPNPLNWYGYSKIAGEYYLSNNFDNYTIFRVQWLFNYRNDDRSFIYKVYKMLSEDKEVSVVKDEIGSPCSAYFLGGLIINLYKNNLIEDYRGIYHLTHEDSASRLEVTQYIASKLGKPHLVRSIPNTSVLKRPKFGMMNINKFKSQRGISLLSYKDDLDTFLEYKKQEIR